MEIYRNAVALNKAVCELKMEPAVRSICLVNNTCKQYKMPTFFTSEAAKFKGCISVLQVKEFYHVISPSPYAMTYLSSLHPRNVKLTCLNVFLKIDKVKGPKEHNPNLRRLLTLRKQ